MNKVYETRCKFKKDTKENWETNNPILLDGEIVVVTETNGSLTLKIGDGTHNYNDLDELCKLNELYITKSQFDELTDDNGNILTERLADTTIIKPTNLFDKSLFTFGDTIFSNGEIWKGGSTTHWLSQPIDVRYANNISLKLKARVPDTSFGQIQYTFLKSESSGAVTTRQLFYIDDENFTEKIIDVPEGANYFRIAMHDSNMNIEGQTIVYGTNTEQFYVSNISSLETVEARGYYNTLSEKLESITHVHNNMELLDAITKDENVNNLNVYNYELVDENGNVPTERIAECFTVTEEQYPDLVADSTEDDWLDNILLNTKGWIEQRDKYITLNYAIPIEPGKTYSCNHTIDRVMLKTNNKIVNDYIESHMLLSKAIGANKFTVPENYVTAKYMFLSFYKGGGSIESYYDTEVREGNTINDIKRSIFLNDNVIISNIGNCEINGSNITDMTITENKFESSISEKLNNIHIHNNKDALDLISSSSDVLNINKLHISDVLRVGVNPPIELSRTNLSALLSNSHTHDNKTVLDGISSTDIANWDSSSLQKHTHDNKSILDNITSTNVSSWNNLINYSKMPVQIGNWVDGTPIWRFAFDEEDGSQLMQLDLSSGSWSLYPTIISEPYYGCNCLFGIAYLKCPIEGHYGSYTDNRMCTFDPNIAGFTWQTTYLTDITGIYGYIDFIAPE